MIVNNECCDTCTTPSGFRSKYTGVQVEKLLDEMVKYLSSEDEEENVCIPITPEEVEAMFDDWKFPFDVIVSNSMALKDKKGILFITKDNKQFIAK